MKYDFIEIGTSNFETLIESAKDDTVGLSIEPIKYYLDCLPEKPKVTKLNCAVSRNNKKEVLQVYYVPESVVKEKNLPKWLTGCNAVGDYHFQHKLLNITDLVVMKYVTCIPIGILFDNYNVTSLDYLKIDTEGSDCDILLHLFDYLIQKETTVYPKKILFESNILTSPDKVELVKAKFVEIGYTVTRSGSDDTILEL